MLKFTKGEKRKKKKNQIKCPLRRRLKIARELASACLRRFRACPQHRAQATLEEVKFIDRDPYYYTRRVKEAIHIRIHPNNINRDSGIEIPEAWMPLIKKHTNRRAVRQRTTEGANH